MGCRGNIVCQWMFDADKNELKGGPYYRRSVPLSQVNATYTAEDPIILVKRNNVPKGWFTFDFRDKTYFRPYIFTRFLLWSLTFFFTAFSPCLERRLLF